MTEAEVRELFFEIPKQYRDKAVWIRVSDSRLFAPFWRRCGWTLRAYWLWLIGKRR